MGIPKVLAGGTAINSRVQEIAVEHECELGMMVDVGNPHLVFLLDSFEGLDVRQEGEEIVEEFGREVNVQFATWDAGLQYLLLRTHERGVGETAACGSGAVASVAALTYWQRENLIPAEIAGAIPEHIPDGNVLTKESVGFVSGSEKITVQMVGGEAKVTRGFNPHDSYIYQTVVKTI